MSKQIRGITDYSGWHSLDWGKWLAVAGAAALILILTCSLAYSIGYSNGHNDAVSHFLQR